MVRKSFVIIVLATSIFSLNSCDSPKDTEDDVISLEENVGETEEAKEETPYKSELFKTYFRDIEKFNESSMESYQEDSSLYIKGRDLPLGEEVFSEVKYANYSYDQAGEIISGAIFLPKGSTIKDQALGQDTILVFDYDMKNKDLNKYEAYDLEDKEIDIMEDLDWDYISTSMKNFIVQIAS